MEPPLRRQAEPAPRERARSSLARFWHVFRLLMHSAAVGRLSEAVQHGGCYHIEFTLTDNVKAKIQDKVPGFHS